MNEKQIKAINDAMSFLTMAATNLDKYPSSQDFSDLRKAHIAAMEEAGVRWLDSAPLHKLNNSSR